MKQLEALIDEANAIEEELERYRNMKIGEYDMARAIQLNERLIEINKMLNEE